MAIKSELLNILNDGQFHSGEDLGQALGVSRTAVWKQLQALESMGLQLESVKGRGYKIPDNFELLDSDQISVALNDATTNQLNGLHIYQSIDSTNKLSLIHI